MNIDLTAYLALNREIDRLKRQVDNQQKLISKLRKKLGLRKPVTVAEKCCKHYKPGITGVELARLAGCSKRYANSVIQLYQLSSQSSDVLSL